jgi:hypothetical protein
VRLPALAAIVGATAVAAVMLCVTGCAHPPAPSAGLTVIGGKPTIVFVSCTQRSANVGVYVDTPSNPDVAGPRPSNYVGYLDWNVQTQKPQRLTEIPLFGPAPAGWTADENAITSLQPGVTYSVSGTGQANALPVSFTVDDLPSLNSGRVMVGAGPGRSKLVSREQFESDAC